MTKIKITWTVSDYEKELGYKDWSSEFDVDLPDYLDVVRICDMVFEQTNVYAGPIWGALQPALNPKRIRTALSVGDYVEVDGTLLRCEPSGWSSEGYYTSAY